MPMTAQNAAHGCDCGKVKVTLLNKRNAAEALTAPLNGKAIAIDNVADLIYIVQTGKSGYTRRRLSRPGLLRSNIHNIHLPTTEHRCSQMAAPRTP